MADTKITALTAISTVDPAVDVLPIVDVSDTTMAASGTTKKITSNQILGAGGTATLASATITGDLTVDTNTFYVKSSTNQVGIGTTSPNANFTLDLTSSNDARARQWFADVSLVGTGDLSTGFQIRTLGTGTNGLKIANAGNTVEWLRIDSTGVHTWQNVGGVAGTAMTLNSTGLGVGQPATTSKLEVGIINTSTAGLIEANALKIENSNATVNNAAGLFLSQSGTAGCGIAAIATSRTAGSRTSDLALYYYNQSTSSSPIEGLRLNSSGNVGVGVTPSATDSTYYQALEIGRVGQGFTGAKSALTGSPNSWFSNNSYATYSAGIVWKYAISQPAAQYRLVDASHQWLIAASGTAGNAITFTQAMTLDASGNLLVGTTSTSNTTQGFKILSTGRFYGVMATGGYAIMNHTGGSGTEYIYEFQRAGTAVGSITTTTTSTAYVTSSDYRLKESVAPLSGGLARVNALKPSIYKWKSDGSSGEGFLAHELAEVVPSAVTGEKDAVNEDGSIKAQGVDLSKVVPILVAAIKELTARVEALEA